MTYNINGLPDHPESELHHSADIARDCREQAAAFTLEASLRDNEADRQALLLTAFHYREQAARIEREERGLPELPENWMVA